MSDAITDMWRSPEPKHDENSDLKPCPFCGRKDVEILGSVADGYYIECSWCSVRMGRFCDGNGNSRGDFNTPQKAFEEWNTRSTI